MSGRSWAIALAVLLFVVLLTAIWYEINTPAQQQEPIPEGDSVLVTINGVPILQSRLDFHYRLLPEAYRAVLTKEDVLDELVSEELLYQAARAEGFDATQEEVHARVQGILTASDMTPAEFEENLASFNVTTEEFETLVARQIVLEQYREAHLSSQTDPSEEEILARYEADLVSYALPERVAVRHVLIRAERDNAATLAKEVYDAVRAGGDFCSFVADASDDTGSKGTCGEYTFGRGVMVPEFEAAAFEMEDGEFRLIQSQFGYHVMEKLASIPAGVRPLADVHDEIAADLKGEAASAQFDALLADLRAQASIVYPDEEITLVPEAPVIDVAPEPVVQPPAAVEVTEPEPVAEESPVIEETVVEEPQPEPVQEETVSPAPEPVAPASDVAAVLSCISDRVILYGTSWSSDTYQARQLFADENVPLRYVECDGGTCGGVNAYPTWDVSGTRYVGRLTLEQLRRATDC